MVSETILYVLLFALILVAMVLGANALLRSKKMHNSSVYLAWFMIYVTLVNLQLWLITINPPNFYPQVLYLFLPFQLLPGPFFLLFVLSYLGKKEGLKRKRLILFTPFWIFVLIYFVIKIDVFLHDIDYALAWKKYFFIFKIEEVSTIFYGLILSVVSYQTIIKFEKEHSKKRYGQVTAHTYWIKRIILIGCVLIGLWMLSFLFDLVSVYRIGNFAYFPAWIGYLLFMIYIGYTGFYQTSVLKERKQLYEFGKENDITSKFVNTEVAPSTLKYFQSLEQFMLEDKLYLNPIVDLNMLAEKIAISPNYLSKVVNLHAKMNFSDYVNTYRTSYAKEMLMAQEFKGYSMLSIALEAGFNSKSSFYAASNKLLGHPPGYFRRSTTDSKSPNTYKS